MRLGEGLAGEVGVGVAVWVDVEFGVEDDAGVGVDGGVVVAEVTVSCVVAFDYVPLKVAIIV